MNQSLTHTPAPKMALATLAAPAVALVLWLVTTQVGGVTLRFQFGSSTPRSLNVGTIVGVSLIASVLGLISRLAMAKVSQNPTTSWTALAATITLLSLGLPLLGAITTSAIVSLVIIHLGVGISAIAALRHCSPQRQRSLTTPVHP